MAPSFLKSLVPKREEKQRHERTFLQAAATITFVQWLQFFTGWLAWTCDAIDFFSVSLSATTLQQQFHKPDVTSITTSITLTLLFRSVGALIFGPISDRFGRKWPLIANLLLISVLELGTGFVQTFPQFLAVRSMFGIGMGGIWGLASASALENLPVEVRGVASGIIQQGYAAGYLIAAVMNLYLVPNTTWRALFWAASGISFFCAAIRALIPESEVFLRAKAEASTVVNTESKTKAFLRSAGIMLKEHWVRCIYVVLLMTGFNFLSHGSQDLYPTYLKVTKGFSSHNATIATIIGNCGAITGGVIAGGISQYLGRRLTIVIFVLLVGAFIPLWILPTSFSGLAAGAFCVQFGVQGAWGIIPIHLSEMAPPAFRSTFAGVAYQLGNMVSSASSQIEAVGGRTNTIVLNGKVVPNYAKVQGIFIGVVAAYVVIMTIIGPENKGSHFEEAPTVLEVGAAENEHGEMNLGRRSFSESLKAEETKREVA